MFALRKYVLTSGISSAMFVHGKYVCMFGIPIAMFLNGKQVLTFGIPSAMFVHENRCLHLIFCQCALMVSEKGKYGIKEANMWMDLSDSITEK